MKADRPRAQCPTLKTLFAWIIDSYERHGALAISDIPDEAFKTALYVRMWTEKTDVFGNVAAKDFI